MIGVPSTKARRVGGHCVAVVCAVAKRRLRTNRTTARDEELSIISVLDAARSQEMYRDLSAPCHAMDSRTVPGNIEEIIESRTTYGVTMAGAVRLLPDKVASALATARCQITVSSLMERELLYTTFVAAEAGWKLSFHLSSVETPCIWAAKPTTAQPIYAPFEYGCFVSLSGYLYATYCHEYYASLAYVPSTR